MKIKFFPSLNERELFATRTWVTMRKAISVFKHDIFFFGYTFSFSNLFHIEWHVIMSNKNNKQMWYYHIHPVPSAIIYNNNNK